MEFKKIIEERLKSEGMTLYGLGKKIKKPSGWIYAVMNHNSPTLKTAQELTEALEGKITVTFENRTYELSGTTLEAE